jgi:MFS family permease
VAALSAACAIGFVWMAAPPHVAVREHVSLGDLLRVRAVVVCIAAVVLGAGTLAMLEPTLALFLAEHVGLGPARIGLVFGAGSIVSAVLHPAFGRIADRTGGRRLVLIGLAGMACTLPVLARIDSFESALLINALFTVTVAIMITPSLSYMADATSAAGVQSFGVAYGAYNVAWALGLLVGPSIGGAAYEQVGFITLTLTWAPVLLLCTLVIARIRASHAPTAQV